MAIIWGSRIISPALEISIYKSDDVVISDRVGTDSRTDYTRNESATSNYAVGNRTYYNEKDGSYYFLSKHVTNYCACLEFDPNDFDLSANALGAYVAGSSTITIKLTKIAPRAIKVGALTSALPTTNAQAYSAINAISSAHVIQAGSSSITWTMTAAELQNAKQYGIAVAQVSPPSISSVTSTGESITYVQQNVSTIDLKYRYTAWPGIAEVLTPENHSVIVGNQAFTIMFRYTNKFGEPAAYLGAKFTNLGTGTVTVICKKEPITTDNLAQNGVIEHNGVGAISVASGTLDVGTYRLDISAVPADAMTYYAEGSILWLENPEAQANEYTVKMNPDTSAITCDGKPVPTVSWTSSSQAAFQVRFGDYDSGARAGNGTSFTVPRIFADGYYPVQVRTATDAGEWSGWTEIEYVEISNWVNDAIFDVTAERFEGNIKLSWTYTLNMEAFPDRYAIFRDGKLIGITGLRNYIDRYASAGTYTVYTMLDNQYLKSNPISVSFPQKYDVISADDGLTYTRLKFTPDMKSQSESHQTEVSFAWFAGRRKPVAMTSNQKTRVKQFVYIFHERADAEFLIDLEGREVLLKNTRGAVIYGILSGLTISDERCPVVSFSIQEIEREGENVEYHV